MYGFAQFEYLSQVEAFELRKLEEKKLKEAGNKRAKEIAEQKYRVSFNLHLLDNFVCRRTVCVNM